MKKKYLSLLLTFILVIMCTTFAPVCVAGHSHDDSHHSEHHHTYCWTKSGSTFRYQCSGCKHNPNAEKACSTSHHKTAKKNHCKTFHIKCSTHDKVKSCYVSSGKKCIKITKHTNTKFTIKCKKKGKCVVKVKMKSGACYTYKIKVK